MSYQVRAMSLGELLDGAFRLLRDHVVVLAGIAAIFHVPAVLAGTVVQEALAPGDLSPVVIGSGAALGLFSLLVQPLVSAAITHAIGELYLGRTTSIGASLRVAFSLLVPVIGTAILLTILIGLGLLLLIVPGIVLYLSFLVVWQVAVFERRFGFAALGRSRELMRGSRGRGLGVVIVSWLIVAVLWGGFDLVVGNVPLLGPVASAAAQALAYAYTSAVEVLLYFDLRCRKEAFDLEHLARLVATRGTVTAAPAGQLG